MWPLKSKPESVIILELDPYDAICTLDLDAPPQTISMPVQSYRCDNDELWLRLRTWDPSVQEHNEEWFPVWRILSARFTPAYIEPPQED